MLSMYRNNPCHAIGRAENPLKCYLARFGHGTFRKVASKLGSKETYACSPALISTGTCMVVDLRRKVTARCCYVDCSWIRTVPMVCRPSAKYLCGIPDYIFKIND